MFCDPCAVLLPDGDRKDKGMLVNRPFSNWVKISNALTKHSKHLYHRDSLLSADTLKTSIENSSSRIDVMMSTTVQAQMEENKHILHQLVRAIMFLARQGFISSGTVREASYSRNPEVI